MSLRVVGLRNVNLSFPGSQTFLCFFLNLEDVFSVPQHKVPVTKTDGKMPPDSPMLNFNNYGGKFPLRLNSQQ